MSVFDRLDATVVFSDEERMLIESVRGLAREKSPRAPRATTRPANSRGTT